MATLSIPTDYLNRLILKVRGLQAREGEVDVDSGSNATDDGTIDALQDSRGDLVREEVHEELEGLSEEAQAELVALLWVGRGDIEPEEWEAAINQARASRDVPTPDYLLGQPLVAELWADGAEKLGINLSDAKL